MTESLRVFKLSNGESIIGSTLGENEIFDFNKPIQISYPLKMLVVPRMTKDGPSEALSLSPWVHPMTEVEYIDINPENIVMSAPASHGLTQYYRHCIDQFDMHTSPYEEVRNPTDEDLREIEVEEALDELTDPNKSETIH